ncbi:MAG: site-specific DNA-methyltransferase [Defluviitaleaceae bacterium]|nr:site-specific DNA-methyltransferase [Defluviitaleaceae bacterium]
MGNISKQKRDDLIMKIGNIRSFISTAPQDENTGSLLTYLSELEKEVKSKKYGLVFEEHREAVDELLDTHIPVLTEDKDLFIDNGGQINFLIEGDNLAALRLLLKTHKGKIDVIYIDPPYNTGSDDFIYNDYRVDKLDTFRHSKWLSFMNARLPLARQLLSETGCILISMGEDEVAALKLLCNSIFGEENFLGCFVVQTAPNARDYGHVGRMHDYALFYAKNADSITTNKLKIVDKKFSYKDSNGGFNIHPLYNSNEAFTPENRPNLYYPFYIKPEPDRNGFCELSLDKIEDWIEVFPPVSVKNSVQFVWRWGKPKSQDNLNVEITGYKMNDGQYRVVQKMRHTEKLIRSILTEKEYITRKGTAQLEEIFGRKINFFPKPVGLIEDFLRVTSMSNSTVLDFFAGSGTTGHATLKLNAKDGGTRRFILCTNNENNICRDITYERIKRVIERENYKDSLKYYSIGYIPISDRVYYEYADELLKHVKELVELENSINFTGNAEIAIVLTEEELEAFIENVSEYEKCCRLYRGHDILLSAEQEAKLQEWDITICVIPDYYYRELEGGR